MNAQSNTRYRNALLLGLIVCGVIVVALALFTTRGILRSATLATTVTQAQSRGWTGILEPWALEEVSCDHELHAAFGVFCLEADDESPEVSIIERLDAEQILWRGVAATLFPPVQTDPSFTYTGYRNNLTFATPGFLELLWMSREEFDAVDSTLAADLLSTLNERGVREMDFEGGRAVIRLGPESDPARVSAVLWTDELMQTIHFTTPDKSPVDLNTVRTFLSRYRTRAGT